MRSTLSDVLIKVIRKQNRIYSYSCDVFVSGCGELSDVCVSLCIINCISRSDIVFKIEFIYIGLNTH